MISTGTPQAAAVVAAPILKLCPAYFDGSKPAEDSAFRSCDTRADRVKARPSLKRKRGPSPMPRTTKYDNTAATGHSFDPVFPTWMVTPRRKGSVLDCLIRTEMASGFSLLFTATSLTVRCCSGSKSQTSGADNSPDLRKPKKPRQEAAHSIL